MASASKSIVAELNKGEKLNGDNYEMWHRKVQLILEEQEALETLTNTMVEPPVGNTAQHRRDMETYQTWKRKNSLARITMLSNMTDALMCENEGFDTAQDMWIALKDKFGGTSTTKLRRLTIKFDTYRKRQNHDMRQHLREMSNMIRELKSAGHTLTDEQQIQAVIRSLPNSWENIKINMTHNDNIKTFDDISRHVELEDERLEAAKASGQLYMAESSKRKTKGFMRKGKKGNFQKGKWKGPKENLKKGGNFKKGETSFQKRGKSAGFKKDKAKLKCYNCGKQGHFARECTKPKKVRPNSITDTYVLVSSSVLLTESCPLWTVDSGATYHVARDRAAFVEYRRISQGTRWIYVGNNSRVEVKGIGICKFLMHGGQVLYLHDVLYAPGIRRNLVSVIVLLGLGYALNFYGVCMDIIFNSVCVGTGYLLNGFIVLNTELDGFNYSNGCFSLIASANNVNVDVNIWHARLGHIGQDRMNRLAREGLIGSFNKIELPICENCLAGKTTRKPFGKGK